MVTDKKDEALKQALEAFEAIPEEIEGWIPDKCTDAVIAIKEALAQPEQGYTTTRNAWTGKATHRCNVCRRDDFRSEHAAKFHTCEALAEQPTVKDCLTVEQPAQQQEPVAWVREHELPLAPGDAFSWVETFVHKTPLYTSPPASKPWVGLDYEPDFVLPGGGHVPAVPVAVYGYCPECGGAGVMRERRPNGDDKCTNGHKYPSAKALAEQPAQRTWVGLTHEDTYEATGTASTDLLDLAKLWSDNKVHVYQFDNEARKIIEAVLRRASAKLKEKNA